MPRNVNVADHQCLGQVHQLEHQAWITTISTCLQPSKTNRSEKEYSVRIGCSKKDNFSSESNLRNSRNSNKLRNVNDNVVRCSCSKNVNGNASSS